MLKEEDKVPSSLTDIIKDIQYIDTFKHPNINEYLDNTRYFEQLNEAVKIIKGYAGEDKQLAEMSRDLLVLSAIHVSTAEMIGYLQGYARHAEENRKVTKSKYAIAIKRKRDEIESVHKKNIKLTETEIDNASRSLAEECYYLASDAETVSQMSRSMWYSIGDFVKILNASITRSQQELFHGRNQQS